MINEGDIVTLKTGGPQMAVGKISKWSKEAVCYLWNEEKYSYPTAAGSSLYFQKKLVYVAALTKVVS